MNIELKTIQDVKEFVEISNGYHDADIVIGQDRYKVDGKSILGIFSLNLLEPLKVVIDSENDNSKIAFYNDIRKWRVSYGKSIGQSYIANGKGDFQIWKRQDCICESII